MNKNDSRLHADVSRYVALATIAFTLIVATVIGTMTATHVISKAFADIQASAGLPSPYASRKEAALLPIPTPQMPGLVAPPSVQAVLSTQSSRMLEQVRVATLEPAPKRVPIRSAKLVSVPLKAKPAQVAESPYAQVAVQ
jgi:hypothetical protein